MNRKKKRLAERRSASKEIRRTARNILHSVTLDPESLWDDDTKDLYPWWENKRISQIQIVERQK